MYHLLYLGTNIIGLVLAVGVVFCSISAMLYLVLLSEHESILPSFFLSDL